MSKNISMVLDINLNEYPKFYALKGKDTLTLKGVIPKNSTKPGRLQNPLYNKKYGYMYFKNDTNKKKLDKFVTKIIPSLDKKISNPNCKVTKEVENNYNLIKHMLIKNEDVKKSAYGVLGLQVEYQPSSWVEDITGKNWDPKFNPIKEAGGTWKFSKSAVSSITNDKIAWLLKDKERWNSFYGSLSYDTKKDVLTKTHKWKKFLTDDKFNSVTIGWGRHARFAFKDKDTKVLTFFDPWKKNVNRTQAFKKMSALIKSNYNFDTKFVNRSPDQSNEGSCTTQALMRALMLADYGIDGATMQVPNDYAVFTSRLTSMCRK